MRTIIITYGLPGCGKTYYSDELLKYERIVPVHMDKYLEELGKREYPELGEIILKEFEKGRGDILWPNGVCLDLLVTTNENLIKIIKQIAVFFKDTSFYTGLGKDFKIVWWEGSREACKKNTEKRNDGRNVSTTLSNIPYEPVREHEIRNAVRNIDEKIKITFEKRMIYTGTNWDNHFQTLLDHSYNKKGNKIYSETWSLGGTWGDCWGNSGTITPEEQPKDFKEFDELLERVCPKITFLQYKIIRNECVEVETDEQGDYYGGYETTARYSLDVKKCYEKLLEMNLIEM